ncbi:hypothetical protein PENSPDRAFT_403445 [Peniophora sp. CONT]|nr:hypothetical protein PENSPDRAFT_403445 [Peniophora sp. CONT]
MRRVKRATTARCIRCRVSSRGGIRRRTKVPCMYRSMHRDVASILTVVYSYVSSSTSSLTLAGCALAEVRTLWVQAVAHRAVSCSRDIRICQTVDTDSMLVYVGMKRTSVGSIGMKLGEGWGTDPEVDMFAPTTAVPTKVSGIINLAIALDCIHRYLEQCRGGSFLTLSLRRCIRSPVNRARMC